MTTTPQEHLVDWLRDAHAMEQQAEAMLEAQAERLDNYPQLRERIRQHIDETRWQRAQLESCLERHGASPSTMKDLTGKLMAFGQGLGGMLASDEVVKGAMAGYVFENLEIASYTALMVAAEAAGDDLTLDACRKILAQEHAMAAWLLEHLPETTGAFLSRSATPGVTASH